MQAAVFHGVGTPLAIEEVDKPELRPGDVMIKIEYCGICGSDLHATQAGDLVVPDGMILGHEFTGEIVEIGAEAGGGWQLGQLVTAVPVNACDDCGRQCKYDRGIHCANNLITGFGAPGAYAEYIRVDSGNVLALPEGLGLREGAAAEPLAVGHHVIDKAAMRPGTNVLIVGLSCAAFARHSGARHVVVSEKSQSRRTRAEQMGATATLNPSAGDVAEAYAALTGGPPDLVIECVGIPGMLGMCIDLVKFQGKVMVCGVCTQAETFVPLAALAKEVCLQWALGYEKRDFEVVLGLLAEGRIDPQPMITHVIGFEDLSKRFEELRTPTDECKILLRPQPGT